MNGKIYGYSFVLCNIDEKGTPGICPILFFKKKEEALLYAESMVKDRYDRYNWYAFRTYDAFNLPEYNIYNENNELIEQFSVCVVFKN